jgi:hypothetical protein
VNSKAGKKKKKAHEKAMAAEASDVPTLVEQ